jgi:hypothetical protein
MKRHLLMIVLQLAANGADAYYTNRNIHRQNFHELNPVARPFTRNTLTLGLTSAAGTGLTLYGESLLRKHGHQGFADAAAAVDISGHTYGAIASKRQAR